MKIVECVPNISEGRRPEVWEAAANAAASARGVTLLNVDPGAETNRTVITFVGDPDAVVEGAFRLIGTTIGLVDMSQHKGAHSRIGAVDVVPFVPVAGVTMEECAELARRLGRRVGEELGIPIYLYEHAAARRISPAASRRARPASRIVSAISWASLRSRVLRSTL